MSTSSSSSSGIGFFGLLAIVFITLKLTGYITWSWWWVTAPIWGPAVLVLPIIAFSFYVIWKSQKYKNKKPPTARR